MDFNELQEQIDLARVRHTSPELPEDDVLFESWMASDDDLSRVEDQLRTRLPEKYKEFMKRFGGGQFLFVDLLPAISQDDRIDDLLTVNQGEYAMPNFVAIAPVGTGDYWGFVSLQGLCEQGVSFYSWEDGSIESQFSDFLEFAALQGLRPGQ